MCFLSPCLEVCVCMKMPLRVRKGGDAEGKVGAASLTELIWR